MTSYPPDSPQAWFTNWWITDKVHARMRGRVLWAFVPHVSQVPSVLVTEGRSEPTDHTKANYRIEPLRAASPPRAPRMPVAALHEVPGELRGVYKAKRRPVLVISADRDVVQKPLLLGSAKWQTDPTILVAPYYGADTNASRSGFKPEFIERIRRCEYRQYMWDRVPLPGANESILRFDHIQPIGANHDSYEWTDHCLSDEAMIFVDNYISWCIEGAYQPDSSLALTLELIAESMAIGAPTPAP